MFHTARPPLAEASVATAVASDWSKSLDCLDNSEFEPDKPNPNEAVANPTWREGARLLLSGEKGAGVR